MKSQKYLIPQQNGEFITAPSMDEMGRLAESNHNRFKQIEIKGIPFLELRHRLRREVSARADENSFKLGLSPGDSKEIIVATGHQPVIYHPGIVFKEMVINALIQRFGFSGLNLVVDTDALGNNRFVSFAFLKDGVLTREQIQLFHSKKNLAFEEIPLPDSEWFAGRLGYIRERCSLSLARRNLRSLRNYEAAANRAFSAAGNLAQFNTFSKRFFEDRLRFRHQEVFLSSLCRSEAFLYLVALILSFDKEFVFIYNDLLSSYRKKRGIRHPLSPFPNLGISSNGVELPFWVYKAKQERSSLSLRFDQAKTWICAGEKGILDIDASYLKHKKIEHLVDAIRGLEDSGYKIRPKALMLTLFARLFLSDLWVHGVGGAEYEELNDALAQKIFAVTLPQYAVASATMHLNFDLPRVSEGQIRGLKDNVRRMRFDPDKFLDTSDKESESLLKAKQEMIDGLSRPGRKRELHRQLFMINERLRNRIAPDIQRLEETISRKEMLLEQNRIARNREFPFFLFALNDLKSLYDKLF